MGLGESSLKDWLLYYILLGPVCYYMWTLVIKHV